MSAGNLEPTAGHGLDFLFEPVLVVALDGTVFEANAAARAFFGARLETRSLSDLVEDDAATLARYLKLAGGSPSSRPGSFSFFGEKETVRHKTQAARSKHACDGVRIILRLLPPASDRFALLDRRVRDLDAKLHKRLLENTALRETLRQNRELLRELQHRVKNNIQMMLSLIKMGAQGRDTPEVAAVVETSRGRLQAMAIAQEALYQVGEIDLVPARAFLKDSVRTAARAGGAEGRVSLSLEDGQLSREEAHCLALIANELVRNAARHGVPDGGNIAVTFTAEEDGYRLTVDDDGPGIPAGAASRTSGLTLVQALCRQIDGRLEIGRPNGATCSVWFRADRQGTKNNDATF